MNNLLHYNFGESLKGALCIYGMRNPVTTKLMWRHFQQPPGYRWLPVNVCCLMETAAIFKLHMSASSTVYSNYMNVAKDLATVSKWRNEVDWLLFKWEVSLSSMPRDQYIYAETVVWRIQVHLRSTLQQIERQETWLHVFQLDQAWIMPHTKVCYRNFLDSDAKRSPFHPYFPNGDAKRVPQVMPKEILSQCQKRSPFNAKRVPHSVPKEIPVNLYFPDGNAQIDYQLKPRDTKRDPQ